MKAGLGQILRETKRLLEGSFPHWCRVQTRCHACLELRPHCLVFAVRWAICISPGAVCAEESYPNPEVLLADGGRGGLEHGESRPCLAGPHPGSLVALLLEPLAWFLVVPLATCAVPLPAAWKGAHPFLHLLACPLSFRSQPSGSS